MNKKIRKSILITFVLIACSFFLISCGQENKTTKVIFTTGFAKDELFRLGDVSCTLAEYMLYLTTTQNQYENVDGKAMRNVQFDEVTL